MEMYEQLKRVVASVEEDMSKAEGGNKAAGTRVRTAMQEIKKLAQEIRNAILEMKKGD